MRSTAKRAFFVVETDTGTENRVVGTRGLGDAVFTRPLVTKNGWGKIKRMSSNDQGAVSYSTGGVTVNDETGWFRDLIKQDSERFFRESEVSVQLLSEDLRKATNGAAYRLAMRGRIEEHGARTDRQAVMRRRSIDFKIIDALAPYLDRKIPNVPILRSDFLNVHRDIEGTMFPLIGGEHAWPDAVDVFGNPVPPGLCPAIHLGKIITIDDVPFMGTPIETSPAYLSPPVIDYSINGTPGTRTVFVAVTALSDVGETTVSNILQIEDAPGTIDGTNSIEITWTDDPEASGYVVYFGSTCISRVGRDIGPR